MSPTFSQNDLRRLVKESLEPMLEQATPDDHDFLADEDFLLRWADGEVSEAERERFLEYLHRNPEALLDVSEMVSSGLLALPPLPKGLETSKPMPEQKRRNYRILYYSSATLILLALLAVVLFRGGIRKQGPEPQIARNIETPSEPVDPAPENPQGEKPPVTPPPETQEKQPDKIFDTEEQTPNPFLRPPAPRPQPWGPPRGGGYHQHGPGGGRLTFPPSHGPTVRSPGGGGGSYSPSFDLAASSEKRVCIIRQDAEGGETVLALDEKLPEIVDWLIEKYKLERMEERSEGVFVVILSENDEKMEFKHSRGLIEFDITDSEQAQNRMTRYFRRNTGGQGTRRNAM